jgi:hypothetical protein
MTSTYRAINAPGMHWGVGALFAARRATACQPVLLVS